MNAAKLIDGLVVAPELALSFDDTGRLTLKMKSALVRNPIQGRREKLEGSDNMLIRILKLNPSMELQLNRSYGMFPYLIIHTNSYEEIRLPKGMFLFRGCVCCYTCGIIMLAALQ